MYDNLSERLNLYLWDSQLNMYYSDGSPYYNRTSGVNCLESSEPFIFYFYVPMVPTNGIWSGVKEAPIDYGVFDKTSKRNIQCPIHIGLVNIKSATWKYELINGTKIIRGNFCFFDLRVFSKDRSSFKDLTIQATVDELSFYILIINHYISTYKDLDLSLIHI